MNSYELSRKWFDYCFDNPEKIKPVHTAMYFFIIEHCNRLGWKEKFGLPMEMTKDAIGISNYRTYSKTLKDLIDWGFVIEIQKSKNQYSSTIIAIAQNTKATTKALDKAMQKHDTKQGQSIVCIDKPNNKEPNNKADDVKTMFDKFVVEVKEGKHQQAIEQMYMRLRIKQNTLTPLLKNFYGQLIIDNAVPKNTLELRKHFNNWLNVQDRVGKLDEYKK